jgi:hypothetical protein
MKHFECSVAIDFEVETEEEAIAEFLSYVRTDMSARDVTVLEQVGDGEYRTPH